MASCDLVEDRGGKNLRGHDLLVPLLLGQIGDHDRGLHQPIAGKRSESQIDRHLSAAGGQQADFAPVRLAPAALPERLE